MHSNSTIAAILGRANRTTSAKSAEGHTFRLKGSPATKDVAGICKLTLEQADPTKVSEPKYQVGKLTVRESVAPKTPEEAEVYVRYLATGEAPVEPVVEPITPPTVADATPSTPTVNEQVVAAQGTEEPAQTGRRSRKSSS